jgi:hypothetical protein
MFGDTEKGMRHRHLEEIGSDEAGDRMVTLNQIRSEAKMCM